MLIAEKRIVEARRQDVRGVRIGVVDPYEAPLTTAGLLQNGASQFVDPQRIDHRAVLRRIRTEILPRIPRLDISIKPLIPAKLGGQHGIGDHCRCPVAGPLDHLGQGVVVIREKLRCPMGHAGGLWIETREHRRERRRGLGPLGDGLAEHHASGGQRIQIGRGGARIAVYAEMIGAQGVDGDEKYSFGSFGLTLSQAAAATDDRRAEDHDQADCNGKSAVNRTHGGTAAKLAQDPSSRF